ncbi:deaminase [Ascochyta rabiei]|uniref:Deaminase n=1 Tax=Didymella rabiei TaxID=5454 RepID=A0A163G9B1_DIDRA|nr:deaminase [Ascochyta rabiei]
MSAVALSAAVPMTAATATASAAAAATSAAQRFASRLPKIELHAHLTGSISRDCLHHIWHTKIAQDAAFDVPDPLLAIPSGKVDYDLDTFFPLFSSYIYKLCSDLPSIEYSTKAVLQDFQADGVVHLELRTTPRAIPEIGVTKHDYVKTVLNVLNTWNNDPASSMHAYLILSVDRRNTLAQAEEVVDLCIDYQAAGVVGIDLCGDPAKGDVRIFTNPFARAKVAGLKMTLHFAEANVSASDAELETLLSWRPDRLGHVIHVKEKYRKLIEQRNIGVELCLSCNVHAKMITGTYGDHHFGMWRHTKVPVALSTDDVGVFCSPLSAEYALAVQHFNLTRSEIKALCIRVVDSIFTGEDEKHRLRSLYSDWDGWAA